MSLEQVSGAFGDEQLDREVEQLNACLYGRAAGNWAGGALLDVVKRLRERVWAETKSREESLSLYPEAA